MTNKDQSCIECGGKFKGKPNQDFCSETCKSRYIYRINTSEDGDALYGGPEKELDEYL